MFDLGQVSDFVAHAVLDHFLRIGVDFDNSITDPIDRGFAPGGDIVCLVESYGSAAIERDRKALARLHFSSSNRSRYSGCSSSAISKAWSKHTPPANRP